jgi:hypothetical protein
MKKLLFPILIINAIFQLARESISKKIQARLYKRRVEKDLKEKPKYIKWITPRTKI